MVKAKLTHNPYLMETQILFNEKEPRINSQVEKYENMKLMNWIHEVPSVFYDEMNGYPFELEFSGPTLEFNELKDTLIRGGITDNQIKLFHKKEIEDRKIKANAIEELIQWLDDNRNRKFDYELFKKNNEELLEGSYQFIVVNCNGIDERCFADADIAIEFVSFVDELENVNLENTPIFTYIDSGMISKLPELIAFYENRNDINETQLFFSIDSSLDSVRIHRIMHDLGIKQVRIVSNINDDAVLNYIDAYQVTDYICDSIAVFQETVDIISEQLESENKESKKINQEIHTEINRLEHELECIKAVRESFENRYNLDIPYKWNALSNKFLSMVNTWRNKKVKITSVDEAKKAAADFDQYLFNDFGTYTQYLEEAVNGEKHRILREFESWYIEANLEDFDVSKISLDYIRMPAAPSIAEDLLLIKDEKYVEGKDDFMNLILKKSDAIKSPILETTYYYQQWREHAVAVITAVINKLVEEEFEAIKKFFNDLAVAYINHLTQCINDKTIEKENVKAQLSEDERQLQNDNDWLLKFKDGLDVILKG